MASRLSFFDKYFIRPFLNFVIKHEMLSFLPVRSGIILDLGCGRGEVSKLLRKMGFQQVVGLEINRNDIIEARKKELNFVQGDAQNLPFKNGIFSAIFCSEVIEHVERDELLMREAFRVLKHGAFLLVTTPDFSSHKLMAHSFPSLNAYLKKLLHNRLGYSLTELKSMGERTGFRVVMSGYILPTKFHLKANTIVMRLGYPINYIFGSFMWMLFSILALFPTRRQAGGISIKVLFQKS